MANRTEAYDLSLFEPQIVRQPVVDGKKSFEAKRLADIEDERKQELREQQKLRAGIRAQRVARRAKVLKAATLVSVSFLCMSMLVFSRAKVDDLSREAQSLEKQIEIAQSENVRLMAQMNAAVSIDRVETYAEQELGMVKMQRSQITYIDMSDGDEVVYSQGSSGGEGFSAGLKELLAYLP